MSRHLLLAMACWSIAAPALANWTWNLGYQNPTVATYGLNLLYLGSQWGFEAGVGWIDFDAGVANGDQDEDEASGAAGEGGASGQRRDDDEATRLDLAGDVDLKYFLASGGLRPFLQAGIGVGLGAEAGERTGVGAGSGGGFAGLGLLIGNPNLYLYGSYNLDGHEHAFWQGGIGFDL